MLNSISSVGSQYDANVFASTFTQKNQSVSAVEEKPVFVERYTAPETNEDTSGVSDKTPVGPKQILIDPLGKNYKFQPASQTAVEEKPVFVERYTAPETNEDTSGVSDKTPVAPKQIPIDLYQEVPEYKPAQIIA
jgi:hypothetical protein